jgi:hypothetical protein
MCARLINRIFESLIPLVLMLLLIGVVVWGWMLFGPLGALGAFVLSSVFYRG